jgi:hypothetical protein
MKNINILKLLSFLFAFVLIVFFIIFVFIVPDIKRLKSAKIANKQIGNVYRHTNDILRAKTNELKGLKRRHSKIIKAFNNRFNETAFLKFSQKYFSYARLTKDKKSDYKQDFVRYSFNTVSKMSDPTVFYRFLTDINNFSNIIQVDFPIEMKAVGDDINTTFKLRVYTLKRK